MNNDCTLFYVHDPMCSWCYGYKPVLNTILKQLNNKIEVKFLLGGLAADTEILMPLNMQTKIKSNWRNIEETIPGTTFNYDFWTKCSPKRSTYPACRAVIAAGKQHIKHQSLMINAIQYAYYLNAQNPSNYDVLYDIAEKINLNKSEFENDIHSENTNEQLHQQIALSQSIGANSFPSIFLLHKEQYHQIVLDYTNAAITLGHIESHLRS